jgi:hypothetical protein
MVSKRTFFQSSKQFEQVVAHFVIAAQGPYLPFERVNVLSRPSGVKRLTEVTIGSRKTPSYQDSDSEEDDDSDDDFEHG